MDHQTRAQTDLARPVDVNARLTVWFNRPTRQLLGSTAAETGFVKFSHLVRINDPLKRLIDPLSRDQVWRGLVLKAENPLLFVHALDGFVVLARDAGSISRELRFGPLLVRDRIVFDPPYRMRQEIAASAAVPAATLVLSIEEPDAIQLSVRFDYTSTVADGGPPVDEMVQGFVRQAYVEADTDTIRTIRRLAVEGKL